MIFKNPHVKITQKEYKKKIATLNWINTGNRQTYQMKNVQMK